MTAPRTDGARVSVAGTFAAALTFFTRLPRTPWPAYRPSDDRYAAAFGPWVGWIVAAVAVLVLLSTRGLAGPAIAAVLTLAVTIVMTGALHEDGLADFCDGFGVRHDRTRTLEIMRDPRTGAFGVLGLVVLTLARFAALSELAAGASAAGVLAALAVAHSASRFAAVSFMSTHDYVRADDADARGARLSRRMPTAWLVVAAIGGCLPLAAATAFGHAPLAWVVVPLGLAWMAFARAVASRLGGYTGDCLGAVQQVSETIALLVASIVLAR